MADIDSNEPILITGGAGFIGSNLVNDFLSKNYKIHVLDNLSSGNPDYITNWKKNENFKFFKLDLLDKNSLDFVKEYKTIFHLAANPDVQTSTANPQLHFEQNVIATFNLLESIKEGKIKNFIFFSTSTVYGEPEKIPTPENFSPLEPISPYGASKQACEALVSSFSHTFGFQSIILRLANIIGPSSTHGVIFDFIKKLKKDPSRLEVLGDGTQNKSYLHVSDCIEAIHTALKTKKTVEFFNIGSEDQVDVDTIAKLVIERMGLNPTIRLTGGVDGGRGWKGDVKIMKLDINKIKNTGWNPKYNSQKAVEVTISEILDSNSE